MHIFRDLFIKGTSEQLAETVIEIERSLPGDWTRDQSEELKMRTLGMRSQPTYCFSCLKIDGRPSATVFLTQKEPGILYASNVIPHSKHQLSCGEFNGILEEFCDHFVRPSVGKTGASVDLTVTQAELEHWLSPAAAEKLRIFSAVANKSTGSAHPLDRQRWNEFVGAAHETRGHLEPATLRRWLIEIEGWPAEIAERLVIEYVFGREILAFAGGRRSA